MFARRNLAPGIVPGVSALATSWLAVKVYPGLARYEDYIELAAWSGSGGISYYE